MFDNLKIIFFGLGSIGSRHLKLIKKNYNLKISAYRSDKSSIPFDGIHNYYNIEEALNKHYDVAFITNPTHLHVKTSLLCIKASIKNLFIEKPISHNLDKVEKLKNELERNNCSAYIAYNMRFNPIIKKLKDYVNNESNNPFFAETRCCSFLPMWRPKKDYRKIYSAKAEEGGGVLLDLSHEFDYNEYLFGKILKIDGIYSKMSSLDINTEDFCNVNIRFKEGIKGLIYLDYFSRIKERWIKIHFQNKEIFADFISKYIKISDQREVKKINFNFDRDAVYKAQLDFYFKNFRKNPTKTNNFNASLRLFKKIIEFKISN